MTQHPIDRPVSPTDVKVVAAAGNLRVEARSLFSDGNATALHSLIGRVFRSEAVHTLRINREQGAVEIRYDRRQLDVASALQQFSHDLTNEESPEDSTLAALLKQATGPVTWVQRQVQRDRSLVGNSGAAGRRFKLRDRFDSFLPTVRWRTGAASSNPRHSSRLVRGNWIVSCAGVGPMRIADGTESDEDSGSLSLAYVEDSSNFSRETELPHLGSGFTHGVKRLANLATAGGCLVMSVVGIVTPGIPTVPFVLATSYFLARSSPALHERFRRSSLFGRMVRDWEERGGLRTTTKLKLIFLTVGLMSVTVWVTGLSFSMIIVIGSLMSIGLFMIWRIPTIREQTFGPRLALATA